MNEDKRHAALMTALTGIIFEINNMKNSISLLDPNQRPTDEQSSTLVAPLVTQSSAVNAFVYLAHVKVSHYAKYVDHTTN